MYYARAVKGPYTEGEIIALIQEQADLELQRSLSKEELISLSGQSSPEHLWRNIEKVFH